MSALSYWSSGWCAAAAVHLAIDDRAWAALVMAALAAANLYAAAIAKARGAA